MSLFRPITQRFREWVKSRSNPMSIDQALERRATYSKIYMFTSIILSGYVMYLIAGEESNENSKNTPAYERIMRKFGVDTDLRVLTIEGFTKKSDITYYKDPETSEIKTRKVTKHLEDDVFLKENPSITLDNVDANRN